jgi:hypothetical protein
MSKPQQPPPLDKDLPESGHPAATALRERVINAVQQALADGLHPTDVPQALLQCLVYTMYGVAMRYSGGLPASLEYLNKQTCRMWEQLDVFEGRSAPRGPL